MGQKKYSREQELQIVEEYRQGASADELAIKYGYKGRKSITDKVKKYFPNNYKEIFEENKNKRKGYNYKLKNIENNFDAYFLGLLLTDGYIVSNRHQVGIDLADEDCISFLSASIGKSYNTYQRNRQHEFNGKIIKDKQAMHRLLLTDKELISNLKRFGVIEHKSLILPPPQLTEQEEQFIPYIIRGIIDGDGTFDVRPNTIGVRITTKSEKFAQWLKDVLENKMFLKDIKIHNNSNIYVVETYQRENLLKIYTLSYNQPFGMMRKYNKIRETFRDYNSSIS